MPNVNKKSTDQTGKEQDRKEGRSETPPQMAEMMTHCCGTGMMAKMASLMGCGRPSKKKEDAR